MPLLLFLAISVKSCRVFGMREIIANAVNKKYVLIGNALPNRRQNYNFFLNIARKEREKSKEV